MPEKRGFVYVGRDVHDCHIVGIDVDGLVADYQFFVCFAFSCVITHDEEITVTNIKLILPFGKELEVGGILVCHSDDEESELLVILVCENIEHLVFFIVDDLFDAPDFHEFIDIQFFFVLIFLFIVDIDTVLWRSCDHNGISVVHLEEFRLS